MGTTRNVYIKDKELDEWVVRKVDDKKFRNYSHAVEIALKLLKEKDKPESLGAF